MMLFGRIKISFLRTTVAVLLLTTLLFACKDDKVAYLTFKTPESGARIATGTSFTASLEFNGIPDSVVYFVDSTRVGAKADTSGFTINTAGYPLGNHVLLAKVYSQGKFEDVTSNIIILAAKAPKEYSFNLINTYPHDKEAYTQGLEFHNGYLYESTGQEGRSSLRKVELTTGKVLQRANLENATEFGEGITIVGNKIVYLTWKSGVGHVYDKATFKKTGDFTYPGREGWGLAFDGQRLLNTDGSESIYFMNKDTYQTTGSVEVYDNNGAVDSLNEIEFINGKVYANVYLSDGFYANKILIINPATGAVEATINLTGLNPEK
ncbi:MAG: glutaminyl-peptide cyclotransferase, partial [Pedobacter sp.]